MENLNFSLLLNTQGWKVKSPLIWVTVTGLGLQGPNPPWQAATGPAPPSALMGKITQTEIITGQYLTVVYYTSQHSYQLLNTKLNWLTMGVGYLLSGWKQCAKFSKTNFEQIFFLSSSQFNCSAWLASIVTIWWEALCAVSDRWLEKVYLPVHMSCPTVTLAPSMDK